MQIIYTYILYCTIEKTFHKNFIFLKINIKDMTIFLLALNAVFLILKLEIRNSYEILTFLLKSLVLYTPISTLENIKSECK